jgi:hypothetical protein
MGASGKKLQGHGARKKLSSPPAQSKDGGYGLPPHPLLARAGQRFAPRAGARRRPFQVTRADIARGRVTGRRLDDDRDRVSISLAGLLRVRPDGQGRHYQFVGFDPRRYRTFATVAAIGADGMATLVLPEWHPSRPVSFPARLVPPSARVVGAWLRCTADLSMGRPAWLNVADLEPCPDPGPDVCHRAGLTLAPESEAPTRPEVGRGCGDIVLDLPAGGLAGMQRRGGLLDVYVIARPRGVESGDRVYLAESGAIAAFLEVRARELRPSGDVLRCEPEPRELPRPLPVDLPRQQSRWRWRWWPRAVEHAELPELVAALAAYDPDEHDPPLWG